MASVAIPVAQDDTAYYTNQNSTLNVTLSSSPAHLLANDIDVEGDSLTASIVSSTSHGTLTPDSSGNGTFSYVPDNGFVGVDSFTYKVNDGTFDSNIATATIAVGTKFLGRSNLDSIPMAATQSGGSISADITTGGLVLREAVVPGVGLIYRSDFIAKPIIVVETQLTSSTTPDEITAQLTFNGTTGSTYSFTSGLSGSSAVRIGLQADGTGLPTGMYTYSMVIGVRYGSTTTTQTFTGQQAIVSRSGSEFGPGWWLDGLDRLVTSTTGALLVRGNGDTLWYPKTGSTYGFAVGDQSQATLAAAGSNFTLTLKTGEVMNFNSSGLLQSIVDTNSNSTTFAYSGTQLTSITDPFSRAINLSYNSGKVSSIAHFGGQSTALVYISGALTSLTYTDPDGAGSLTSPVTSFSYTSGVLTTRTNAVSEATSFTFDSNDGRLRQITHPDTKYQQFIPIETIGLPTGLSSNALKKPADANGRIRDENGNYWYFRSDRFGLITQTTTPLGNVTNVTRNDDGVSIITVLPDPDDVAGPLSSSVYYVGYNEANDPTFQQNSVGGKSTLAYGSLHRVTSTVDEVNRSQSFTYDAYGNMLTSVDGGGFTTTYVYNARGQVTSETPPDPDGAGSLTAPVTQYVYSSTTGQLLTITNPDNSTQVFTYNAADQLLTAKDESNKTITLTYDALGRMATYKDRVNTTTNYYYDAMSRLIQVKDAFNSLTDYAFNNRGWVASITHPDPDGGGSLGRPTDTRIYDGIGQVLTVGVEANNYNSTMPLTYDADGRRITKADPSNYGSIEQYVYDKQGRLIKIQDPSMNETVMTYDGDGRMLSRIVQGFSGGGTPPIYTSESATYSLAGELLTTTDGRGNTTSFTYNSRGLLSAEILPDPDGSSSQFGRVITYTFDNMGRNTNVNFGTGRSESYQYNSRSRLTKRTEQDPDGGGSLPAPVTNFAYNTRGDLTSETLVLSTGNRVTSYTYDNEQRLLTVTDPDPDGAGPLTSSVTTATYNSLGWLLTVTDANGGVTSLTYDFLGRRKSITEADPDGSGAQTSPVTNFYYDAQGLFKVTDPLGHDQTVTRDAGGRVITQTDTAGNVTDFEYNFYNQLKKRIDPDPDAGGPLTRPQTTLNYDAAHRLNSKTDPMSGTTSYGYDAASNVTTLTDSVGNTTNFGYDGQNQLIIATNALSKTKSYDYDIAGNLVRTIDRNGNDIQYVRDNLDRVTSEKWQAMTNEPTLTVNTTQQGGQINEVQRVGWTTTAYSVSGTFTLAHNGQTTSAIAYNASADDVRTALEALSTVGAGNVAVELLSVPFGSADRTYRLTFQGSKAATNVPQTTTDVTGLSISPPMGTSITAVSATDATGGTFSETQTLVLANATAGTWRLAYNGQVTSRLQTTATASQVDTALEALSGIGSGNLTTTGSAGNFTITFTGSKANTNMLQVFGDASTAYSGTTTRTITTTYNNAGEVASISDPAATITYTRDRLGRATNISNAIAGLTPTVDFGQVFDKNNNRTQLTAVIGGTNDFKNDYTFDALNRLTDITQQGNSGNTVGNKHVTIGYNELGQRTSLSRYESLGTTSFVGTTNWGYDSANRLSTLDHIRGAQTFATYDYSYDGLSRLTSIDSSVEGVSDFTFDATSQVTAADHSSQTDETYSYDLNGNRNSSGFTTGQNNQTLAGGGFTYTYDDEGNRTSRTETATGKVEEYVWDFRNRLVTVRDRNSSGGPIVMQVDYVYDALNRMVKRTYDADGAGSGTAADQYWAYDEGINALLEFNGSAATNLTHRYLWSDQVDELLADSQLTNLTTAGNALWAFSDHLGTIRDIADYTSGTDSTAITNHRTYNAYGKLVSETNSAVDLLFGFTGKQLDEATNLQHNLFRWYDANLGQWLSEDPISFAAGDENVRRYVGNNIVDMTDQLGLADGHHWIPVAYIVKALKGNKLTVEEYYYLFGRFSGPLDHNHNYSRRYNDIRHVDYSSAVGAEMDKWLKNRDISIREFVNNIEAGKSYNGKHERPVIKQFNDGVKDTIDKAKVMKGHNIAEQRTRGVAETAEIGRKSASGRRKLVDALQRLQAAFETGEQATSAISAAGYAVNNAAQAEIMAGIITDGNQMTEAMRHAENGNADKALDIIRGRAGDFHTLPNEMLDGGVSEGLVIGFQKAANMAFSEEKDWSATYEIPKIQNHR